jgi:ATP-dependent 26S proteasome regulatory subunit
MSRSNTNINVPQSTNSIQLNPHDYVNKGINDITLEYFNLINPEQKKSIGTLFIGVGILIGADILKSIIQNVIRDNQKNINDFLIGGLQIFSFSNIKYYFDYTKYNFFSIYNYCKYSFVKKNNHNVVSSNQDKTLSVEIKCDEIFSNNLIMLLENYKINKNNYELIDEISFNEEYDSTLNINQSNTKIYKNLFDIKIIYKNNLFIGINKISYEYNYNGNLIRYINDANLSFFNIFSKKYIQFKEIYEIAEKINSFKIKDGVIFCTTASNRCIDIKNAILSKNMAYYILAKIYETNKSIDNINVIMTNIEILANTLEYVFFTNSSKKLIYDIRYKLELKLIDTYNHNFNIDPKLMDIIESKSNDNSINLDNMLIDFDNTLGLLLQDNSTKSQSNSNTNSNTNNENLKINFQIENKYNDSSVEINNKLVDFTDYVQTISKKHKINKQINIYTIKTINNKIIEKTDNPEYKKYYEIKKKLLDESKDISTKEIINTIGMEPDPYISIEKSNYKIENKVVNKKYCSFDNLYLRKQQDTILFNLTQRFLNDKKLMEELGIPNKLGVLLYGEPGCGKTTTIITLGSYLGRDIFYLNLKSIETNGELKMIFDYVNSEHSGGGIIVLEDIDAMTNIVANRSGQMDISNKTNTNDLVDSDEDTITLEYLLNLLDGTLTFNDSVVIITTNHLEKLDPAIYRPGRIDNLIEMKKCDHYQISRIFKRFIKRDIDSNVLDKIQENKFTPAKIIFNLINWVKKREESDSIIMSEFIS